MYLFTKIRKSTTFKVLFYLTFFDILLSILAFGVVFFLLLVVIAGSMWSPKDYTTLALPIDSIYYDSFENVQINITEANLDKKELLVEYTGDITLNKAINLYQYDSRNDDSYKITNIYINGIEVPITEKTTSSSYFSLNSLDKLNLKIKMHYYNVTFEEFDDFQGFIVINSIPNSTLSIPEGYKLASHQKITEDLQVKEKKIIISFPGFSQKYKPIIERIPLFKVVEVILIISAVYVPLMIIFSIVVFTGSFIEKKKAKKHLAS